MRALKEASTFYSFADWWRRILLLLIVIGSLVFMLSKEPFRQNPHYHNFADQRVMLGVPHFLNVTSNVPFLLVGVAGVIHCLVNRKLSLRIAWLTFFSGVALVGVGSAYYHLNPNNATLV